MNTEFNYTNRDRILAILILIFSFGYVQFVIWHQTGFFTSIFFIALALFFLVAARVDGKKITKYNYFLLILILLFSTVYTISANSLIHFLVTCFLFVGGSYFIFCLYQETKTFSEFFFLDLIQSGLIQPFYSFGKLIPALFYRRKQEKPITGHIFAMIAGFVVLLPFTFIIASLLMSADSGVERMLSNLFSINLFDTSQIFKVIFSIIIAFYLFGSYFSNKHHYVPGYFHSSNYQGIVNQCKRIPALFFFSGIAPILFLYVIYFISQLQYYIGAFSGTLPAEFTFAEYARRGFFELSTIAVLNLLLFIGIQLTAKSIGAISQSILKTYNIIISVFTLILLSTAFCKMLMYIQAYGLTSLRVYTTWFMVLIAVIFVLLIIKEIFSSFPVIRACMIGFLTMFVILCFSNIDKQIARYNMMAAEQGQIEELDLYALSTLSDDAAYYLVQNGVTDYNENLIWKFDADPYARYHISSYLLYQYLQQTN